MELKQSDVEISKDMTMIESVDSRESNGTDINHHNFVYNFPLDA